MMCIKIRLVIVSFALLVVLAMTDMVDAAAECYFAQVQFTSVIDRDPISGQPITFYVYFYSPGGNRLVRSLTFWTYYAPGDWLRICADGKLPWGEWQRNYPPLVVTP